MTMRRTAFFVVVNLLAGFSIQAESSAVIPTPLPSERYQTLIKKSPFAPATAGAAPAAVAGFATNYYVSGVAKIGDRDFVTIASRDGQSRFSLSPGDPEGPDGITVTKIQWSDQLGKSKVTMKKGSEVGVAEFDQAALQKPPVPQGVPPQIQRTGLPGMTQVPQGQAGGSNAPQTMGVPQIPRPGQPALPTTPQPGETRRRIRIINSAP